MMLALVRSLRRVELCRRDFVVLLGTEVALSARHKRSFEQEGVVLHPTPPLIPGIPTADKLHVWRLTQYSQCIVLDADVMVLRPLDNLLGPDTGDFTIGHHPYDALQAQCGVPVAARGIAAMFVMRPSVATHDALMQYLRRRFKAEQLLYSDQTGLMCFFGKRAQTLPCAYVYDVSMMSDAFLPRFRRNCQRFVTRHVLKNCLRDVPGGCQQWASVQTCNATNEHIRANCRWASLGSPIHAVHFKGNKKPFASAQLAECQAVLNGALAFPSMPSSGIQARTTATDSLVWDDGVLLPGAARRGACISVQRQTPVFWAGYRQARPVSQRCCHTHVLLSAYWNEFAAAHDGALVNEKVA